MTIKTVEFDGHTFVAGLTKLSLIIHRYILVLIIFGRMTGDTAIKAYDIIAVCPDSLTHGQIAFVKQEFHMVTTHVIRIGDNTALQPGCTRARQHFC